MHKNFTMATLIIIHHVERDKTVSITWSEKLRDALIKAGEKIEYYSYPAQGHTLEGKAWEDAMKRTVAFFDRYVKGPAKN